MNTVLITGANRGLGLELARQYASGGWNVIATARAPEEASDLNALAGTVRVCRYDARDDDSAETLARDLNGQPIDIVIMNAATKTSGETAPDGVTIEDWNDALMVNTFAPLYLATRLRPNLEAGQLKVLAAISGLAASASSYQQPREIAYRASKAALNQMWRNLTVDWRSWDCKCVMLHPGSATVQAKTNFDHDPETKQVVTGMRNVLGSLTSGHSGSFLDCNGKTIPW